MSSGAQVDLDWSGMDSAQGDAASQQPGGGGNGASAVAHLTDEEILGIDAPAPDGSRAEAAAVARLFRGGEVPRGGNQLTLGGAAAIAAGGGDRAGGKEGLGSEDPSYNPGDRVRLDQQVAARAAETAQAEARATRGSAAAEMPAWMAAAAADPAHGAQAAALWREHQEFRAAFASPEEARAVKDETRAIKELLPGGVRDIVSLREATQSVERIDAALFSGDARAQAEVVAEIARVNPAAFRSLFAEAAKFLAGGAEAGGRHAGGREAGSADAAAVARLFRGGEVPPAGNSPATDGASATAVVGGNRAGGTESLGSEDPSYSNRVSTQVTNHESRVTNHGFDPAAYAAFERATNDAVARDVRGSIGATLARVMPDGVAEGAARRIGEDIFNEVHRALAADRALSEQVASILRDPSGASATGGTRANAANAGDRQSAGAWRFGSHEQQRVAALLAWRAKQLVPSMARRVIGEWTSSVLNTARAKSARQAAAAARVDIASPGGSLDSMPLRQMSPREVNYASMSDEQILGM